METLVLGSERGPEIVWLEPLQGDISLLGVSSFY